MGKAYVYVGTNSLRGSQGIYTLSLDTQSGKMEVIDTAAARIRHIFASAGTAEDFMR